MTDLGLLFFDVGFDVFYFIVLCAKTIAFTQDFTNDRHIFCQQNMEVSGKLEPLEIEKQKP